MSKKWFAIAAAVLVVAIGIVWACGGQCEQTAKADCKMTTDQCQQMSGGAACPASGACTREQHNMKHEKCEQHGDMKHAAAVETKMVAGSDTPQPKAEKKDDDCGGGSCGSCGDKKVEKASNEKKLVEGNIYTTADGTKRFICPVMRNHGNVAEAKSWSDVDGKRYYHCCPGCEEPFRGNPAKYLKDLTFPANIKAVDGKKMTFVCPVTKEEGVVSKETAFVDHEGKRYYFCCKDCVGKFNATPEKYSKI